MKSKTDFVNEKTVKSLLLMVMPLLAATPHLQIQRRLS